MTEATTPSTKEAVITSIPAGSYDTAVTAESTVAAITATTTAAGLNFKIPQIKGTMPPKHFFEVIDDNKASLNLRLPLRSRVPKKAKPLRAPPVTVSVLIRAVSVRYRRYRTVPFTKRNSLEEQFSKGTSF